MKSYNIGINFNKEIVDNDGISLCLGNFDGLHIGHLSVLRKCLFDGSKTPSVMSFAKPLGLNKIKNKSEYILINNSQKEILLKKMGFEYLYLLNNDEILNLNPESFIKEILLPLNVKEIFCGTDFKFGKNASGDVSLLKKYFKVFETEIVKDFQEKISTHNIIEMIKNGDIEKANKSLDRMYEVVGKVIKGNQIGRTIGFPTANVELSDSFVIPKNGVYSGFCYVCGIPYKAIINVGIHPTINELKKPIIECHLIDFDEDCYNKIIYVSFNKFIREEKKFNSLDELRVQIEKDKKFN